MTQRLPARITAALAERSPRERMLLAGMFGVALPLALWALVAEPLLAERGRAKDRLAEAVALEQWVHARDAEWRASGGAGDRGQAVAPAGIAALEQALDEAGLSPLVKTLENGRDGQLELSLDMVAFADLTVLLDRAESELGYFPAELILTAKEDPGQIAARITFAPI